jgi:integrase
VFLGWCQAYEREPLRVSRGELEMYVRNLEGRGYAAATVARRFGTVATFYKFAVINGLIPANPAAAATRPKVAWEGQKRTVLHPLEFAALLAAARTSGPNDRALVCLLGMLGLRVSEACATDIPDLRYEAGYELLHVLGKGAKPADIPLPIPLLRAVREADDGRTAGARSCGPAPGGGWTAPAPPGHSAGSPAPPASLARSARTAFAGRSAPPAGCRDQHPRHAVRDAPRRPAHHHSLRHGKGQPRPARRPRRGRLPRRYEHRLTPPLASNRTEPALPDALSAYGGSSFRRDRTVRTLPA